MNKEFTGEKSFIDVTDFSEAELSAGSLNDLLRNQLNQLASTDLIASNNLAQIDKVDLKPDTLLSCVHSTVTEILNEEVMCRDTLELKLHSLFDRLYDVYQRSDIDQKLRTRQFISSHGLVMSPDHCVTTQKDVIRVRAFIRGAHQAISTLRRKFDGCLHIVYPACGPFAPLLLPLIAYYKQCGLYDENDLRITLIDLQPGAIESLNSVVHEMGIAGYINEIICKDACLYQTPSTIHMVVLEAMQHGFSKEAHLPIARHLASIMDVDGIFLPQEVTLSAVLTQGQKEFVEQWQNEDSGVCEADMKAEVINERLVLGDILRLTADSIRSLEERVLDENTKLIECKELLIPIVSIRKPLLVICTHIKVYDDHYIGEYDSGITHPLPDMHVCVNFKPNDNKPGDLLVKSGDKLKFYYRLNGLPGFLATIAN